MVRSHRILRCRYTLIWVGLGLCVSLTSPSWGVPSFARQTGMACAACHTVFPELTPFWREFKLNGYVLGNIKQITGIDTSSRQTLAINSLPPLSMNVEISYAHTGQPLPDSAIKGALAKDGDLLFPEQVSFFYAGKIADGLGASYS
jgi:iron:rusticyanin reductase